ncbi:MAG: tRNA (N(6)-L-threonylcarbamoyladenosine(37)-C(2))-methylthiotransferase MtaB [Patescibacteria group bacterium]
MQKLTYKIYTLGCKVNQYDSGSLAVKLSAAGFIMKKNNADLAVINTCAVTKTALRKDRQMIVRARRENPRAKIAIVGCAVKIYKEEVEKWGGDFVLTGSDLDKFIKIQSTNYKAQTKHKTQSTNCQSIFLEPKIKKSRYFLKVQDGCRQFCSYCIVPYARGELKSRSLAEVLAEAQIVAEAGIKEIVLCGIHLGLYGQEIKNKKLKIKNNLTALLKELIKIKNLSRIRLSSIEVNEVTDELIELMKKERKLCRQLHIPLQSGCDKILKLMNRPYTTKIFEEKIKKIRKALPDIAITTDVIVGFPGETEKDFRATMSFIKKTNFSKLHVFPFSAHERTPAARMLGQIDDAVKNIRVKKLNELSRSLEKTYTERFINKSLKVIIDGRSQGRSLRGKTEYNFDIRFVSEKKYNQGEVAQVKNWELL